MQQFTIDGIGFGPNLEQEMQQAKDLHNRGFLQEAEEIYRSVLDQDPAHSQAYHLLGLIGLQAGKHDAAADLIQRSLGLEANQPAPWISLGSVRYAQNKLAQAEECYRQALRLDPENFQALLNLGITLHQQKRYQEAVWPLDLAVQVKQDHPWPFALLAKVLMHLERLQEAEEIARAAAKLGPKEPQAIAALTSALQGLNKPWQARYWARRLTELEPDNPEFHVRLSSACLGAGLAQEAEREARLALQLAPESPLYYKHLSQCLVAGTKWDEALQVIEQGLELDPKSEELLAHKASVLERKGAYQESYQLIRPLVVGRRILDAQVVNILSTLSRQFGAQQETAALLQEVLQNQGLPQGYRQGLYFILAELYDDLGEYDLAFQALEQANTMKPRSYHFSGQEKYFARLREAFSPEFLEFAPRADNPDPEPIFIVGMPRSGTSLTEQILASHSQVFGAGELNEIGEQAHNISKLGHAQAKYPESAGILDQDLVQQLADNYLLRLQGLCPDPGLSVTDKMPQNFLHLGLISLMFPRATIIHCRRDPMDTCLSCYFQNFVAQGLGFAYSQEALAHYYRLYQDLMQHWRENLPLQILELDYEDLVQDTKSQVARLLDYCGLDWEDSCLEFHRTKRDIKTASYDQVRKPIYSKSVHRWENYARHLGTLKQGLGLE